MTTTPIDYDHARNLHTVGGAAATLATLLRDVPRSLLDVGCGTGTWLRAAADLGVAEVYGLEGVAVPDEALHVAREAIEQRDLAQPFDLGRRFDVALCLEVAEHLPAEAAAGLVASIAAHADLVLFGAACPDQYGQNHQNCQWPAYWQDLFNRNGFACDDSARWAIWDDRRIEPWYRQNTFWARRDDRAGSESRIKPVIHPEMIEVVCFGRSVRSRPAPPAAGPVRRLASRVASRLR